MLINLVLNLSDILFVNFFKFDEKYTKKPEILAKSKLNNIKAIYLKAMQDSNILERDYVFLHHEVNRCHNLKEGIRKKIRT